MDFREVKKRKSNRGPKVINLTEDFKLFTQPQGLKSQAVRRKHFAPLSEATSSFSSLLSNAISVHEQRILREGREKLARNTLFFNPEDFDFLGFEYKGERGFIGNKKLRSITTQIISSKDSDLAISKKIEANFFVVFDNNSHFNVGLSQKVAGYLNRLLNSKNTTNSIIDSSGLSAIGIA